MIRLGNGTVIRADPRGSHVVLPQGYHVVGRPRLDDEYAATARRLGYGSDVLTMCREHDPLHARLCDFLGFRDSFALRSAAGLDVDPVLATLEEAAVLATQALMVHARVRASA